MAGAVVCGLQILASIFFFLWTENHFENPLQKLTPTVGFFVFKH